MRSLTKYVSFLILFVTSHSIAQTQAPPDNVGASVSTSASEDELNELRSEVATQRKVIEELKTAVDQLKQGKEGGAKLATTSAVPVARASEDDMVRQVSADSDDLGRAHLANTVLMLPPVEQAPPAPEPKKSVPLAAGWNGEHFFIRSADGQFSISPYGYVDTDYRAYNGDGAPAATFLIRRARFGFQGNYGPHFDFALLTDANATSGAVVRDVYLNVRIRPEFQFQAGQFKEPFAQETAIGATNLDFVERGLQALLYPCAITAFRCPGITIHGDISGGVVQYWAGAFNGRGGVAVNVTNEPEFVGRLRFYPWRKSKHDGLKQFAFGGSVGHGRSRGLSNDVSFNATLPNGAYTFFPQLRINGPVERYEGEFTYLKGPFALRGEYVQLQEQRYAVGSETPGGIGFFTLPGVGAKGWNIATTYLLTREKRPENGTPRVKHPLLGPDTPGGKGRGLGAFELGVRYSGIQAKAPSANFFNIFTPGFVPAYNYHTDEITLGLNWYVNYWVKYQVNLNIDQLHQPSVTGQLPQNFYAVTQELQFRF